MNEISSTLTIVFGILVLIINLIIVFNIVKAGKYSQLTYQLLKHQISKLNEKENNIEKQELEKKNFNKNIYEIWNEIQNEDKIK
jgi:uncharacterized ion transporter superfamily protein YfcC